MTLIGISPLRPWPSGWPALRLGFPGAVKYTALTMPLTFTDVASISRRRIMPLALCVISLCLVSIGAQDRLRSMPGYDQSQRMQTALQGGGAFVSGSITPSWAPDAQSFTYAQAGKNYRPEIATVECRLPGQHLLAISGRSADLLEFAE